MKRRLTVTAEEAPGPLPPPAQVVVTPPALPTRVVAEVQGPSPWAPPAAAALAGTATVAADGPASGARPTITLRLSDGTTVTVTGSVIVGRHPSDPHRYDHSITLPDANRTLSRDHLELGFAGTQFWVSDCGSSNGSYLSRAGQQWRLPPREHTPLAHGDIVRFGDHSARVSFAG